MHDAGTSTRRQIMGLIPSKRILTLKIDPSGTLNDRGDFLDRMCVHRTDHRQREPIGIQSLTLSVCPTLFGALQKGHIHGKIPGVQAEVDFVRQLFNMNI